MRFAMRLPSIVAWMPVFTKAARCDILTDSLTYCRDPNGLKIYGWVILDSHFHAILAAPDLSRTPADLKRTTAQRLLDPLEAENCEWLLHQFEFCRAAHKAESRHPVWLGGAHPAGNRGRRDDGAEAGVSAPQPGEARAGGVAGALAVFVGARVVGGGGAGVAVR